MSSRPTLLFPLAFLLVLSVMSCSERDEPVPAPPPATGSYKLDGQLVTCPRITVGEDLNRGGLGVDVLLVQLIVPATDQSPADNMMLSYLKGKGDPVSEYSFHQATHITFPGSSTTLQTRTYNVNRQFTLAVAADGTYSGTFSCISPAFGSGSASQISEGVFAGVRP